MSEKIDVTKESIDSYMDLINLLLECASSVETNTTDIGKRLELENKLGKFISKSNIDRITNMILHTINSKK